MTQVERKYNNLKKEMREEAKKRTNKELLDIFQSRARMDDPFDLTYEVVKEELLRRLEVKEA